MKKMLYFLTLAVVLIMLAGAGCSTEQGEPGPEPGAEPISGTVYSIEDGRILVVSGIEDVNIPRSEWFEQGNRAVYFAIEGDTVVELNSEQVDAGLIARGQKVDVYHEGFLAESYPEQGKALKVVITDPEAAEEAYTDSGRFIGIMVNESVELLEVEISGVPEEMGSRFFRITDLIWTVVDRLDLEPEEEIIFRYLEDDESDGLVFDMWRIEN
ncbi:MAG: DUF3221 domain-containing protein [Bacillota bacterium]